MRRRAAVYVAVFAACGAVTFAAGWIGWWAAAVRACPAPPPGTFLAYCRDERYGDFEHGALLYGLEPEALQHARAADVIIVGNSRAQVGFSTEATRAYFSRRGWRHYLLGMGYGSTSGYAEALLHRYGLRPRVLVVNADPFFTRDAPSVVADVLRADARTSWAYRRKALFQKLHRFTCARASGWCGEPVGGIHRRVDTGEWVWDGVLVRGDLAVPFAAARPAAAQTDVRSVAEPFVSGSGVGRRCILMTDVPGLSAESRELVTSLAAGVGTAAILPSVDGLASLDGDHLNAPSAERWSAAFWAAADSRLTECLSPPAPNPSPLVHSRLLSRDGTAS